MIASMARETPTIVIPIPATMKPWIVNSSTFKLYHFFLLVNLVLLGCFCGLNVSVNEYVGEWFTGGGFLL